MTDIPDIAAAPPTASGSFFGNLFNLYFEPRATFERIFTKPRILVIILVQVALGVLFSTVWFQKLDAREFMRQQMEQNSRIQQMPAEQVERILDSQVNFMKTWGRIGPFIAPVIFDLIVAGFLMFVFRFFLAADVSMTQSLAVVAWSFAAMSLVQTPLLLLVMYLKDDWNVSPDQVLQANPAMFLTVGETPRWLLALASSFDLFTIWTVFLMATGYAVAAKRPLSSGLWGVCVPWGLYILAKVAFILLLG